MIDSKLCIRCKGRLLCGLSSCPILSKLKVNQKFSLSKDFSGFEPNSVFISWNNYPNISISPLTASNEMLSYKNFIDNDERWFGFSQEEIIGFRQALVRPYYKTNVFQASNPDYKLTDLQEIVMSDKLVDVEVELEKKPSTQLEFDSTFSPIGPAIPQKKFTLTSNPKVNQKIDYISSDLDLKAVEALKILFEKKISENQLAKVFSAGLLGVQKQRRLVPTRWAITSLDDILSKQILSEVKHFSLIDSIQVFKANFIGNYFHVLLLPREWSFEMLESWLPGSVWTSQADSMNSNLNEVSIVQDCEFFDGRKNYADNITGAYYAARLMIAEHLKKIKRQASVIVFREVTPEYKIGLGVWVIRETIRQALNEKPLNFTSLPLALEFISKNMFINFEKYLQSSLLLDFIRKQKTLAHFV